MKPLQKKYDFMFFHAPKKMRSLIIHLASDN